MERREFLKAGTATTLSLVFPGAYGSAMALAGVASPGAAAGAITLPPHIWSPRTLVGLNVMTLECRHEEFIASASQRQPSQAEYLGCLEPARLLSREFSTASALQPGTLTLIAGRRGAGATTLAMNIIREFVCDAAVPVALFTTDMSGRQAMEQVIQNALGVETRAMEHGLPDQFDFDRVKSALTGPAPPLYVDDRPDHSIEEIVALSKAIKMAVPALGLVVVDEYRRTAGSSESCVPTELRQLANELHVPVLLVSRLYGMLNKELLVRPSLRRVADMDGISDNVHVVALIWQDLLKDYGKEWEWWWRRFEVAFHNLADRNQRDCALRYYPASGRFGVWV